MNKKTKIILTLNDLRGEVLFKCRDFSLAEDVGVKIEEIIDLLENSVIIDKDTMGLFNKTISCHPAVSEYRLISNNAIRIDNEYFNIGYIEDSERKKVVEEVKRDLLSSLEEEIEDENN